MKRSKSEWLRLIEEFEQSGLSAAAFCRERGVNAKYFSLRKKQLKPAARFVEAKPVERSADSSVEIRVVRVRVPVSDLPRYLNELV